MPIAKRPKPNPEDTTTPLTDDERERRERAFLAGAPDMPKPPAIEEKPRRQKMQTVHLRFEPDLLPRMDAAARASGHDDRSAWIRFVVKQALRDLDGAK